MCDVSGLGEFGNYAYQYLESETTGRRSEVFEAHQLEKNGGENSLPPREISNTAVS